MTHALSIKDDRIFCQERSLAEIHPAADCLQFVPIVSETFPSLRLIAGKISPGVVLSPSSTTVGLDILCEPILCIVVQQEIYLFSVKGVMPGQHTIDLVDQDF
jgi:hypothetical protein